MVPSFFLIMDDLSRGLGWIFGRFVGPKEKERETMEPEDMTAALSANAGEITALRDRLSRLEAEAGRMPPKLVVSHEAAE